MADNQNTSTIGTGSFDKELNKDVNDFHLPKNSWVQARNAINNSITGDLGKLGNEPSNLKCIPNQNTDLPFTIIGAIHLIADYFVLFSTDDITSKIGIFKEDGCQYTEIVSDQACLGFKRTNLIKGVARAKSTCVFGVYWDDGRLNSSRTMEVIIEHISDNFWYSIDSNGFYTSPIPWKQTQTVTNDCITYINTPQIDCDKIRMARLMNTPCIILNKGISSGTLLNGSYIVAIAYAINGQKISDWYISNVQAVFAHDNAASSLDIELASLDTRFDQIIVGLISITNQQTVVRQAGIYSTHQKRLSFDTIQNEWPVIPIEQIPLMTPIADSSDAMYTVNDYLLRVGPQNKEDFNYQPLANQIVAKWQSIEYPNNYYRKGGHNTGYMRDEIYPFFIRWIYNTGDKSSSYHIPGRPGGITITSGCDFAPSTTNATTSEIANGTITNWQVNNTAEITGSPLNRLPDGGIVIAEGYMGYWESTEKYPDTRPDIWNANIALSPYDYSYLWPTNNSCNPLIPTGQAHDLCGKPIRHHRFPDLELGSLYDPITGNNLVTGPIEYLSNDKQKIRILGVVFENIKPPVDNNGNPITNIVGYEILRGTRNGNKTILAKGLISNLRKYDVPEQDPSIEHYFPNYPYNDLHDDQFLSSTEVKVTTGFNPFGGGGEFQESFTAQTIPNKNLFTFHSPDTNFVHPFLSAQEMKICGEMNGTVTGRFQKSEKHPQEKLLTNMAFTIAAITGLGIAGMSMQGNRSTTYKPKQSPGYSEDPLSYEMNDLVEGTGTTVPTPRAPGSDGAEPTFQDGTIFIPEGEGILGAITSVYNGLLGSGAQLFGNIAGVGPTNMMNPGWSTYDSTQSSMSSKAFSTKTTDVSQDDNPVGLMGTMGIVMNLPMFFTYFSQATDTLLDFFRAIVRYRDYALRYESHGYYNNYIAPVNGNKRRDILTSEYIGPQISSMNYTDPSTLINHSLKINNLYRVNTVALVTDLPIAVPLKDDNTRQRASDTLPDLFSTDQFGNNCLVDPTRKSFNTTASSHYVSLKQHVGNLYGQITGVIQILASPCSDPITSTRSSTIFGGDTYVGRYTEKNTFFFFYDWLYGQDNGTQFDYTKSEMIPYPRYWANFNQFEVSDLLSSFADMIGSLGSSASSGLILPSSFYNLDGGVQANGTGGSILGLTPPVPSISLTLIPPSFSFSMSSISLSGILDSFRLAVKDSWFYLFSSGIKDFYTESEINLDLRDWGQLEVEQHYDPYRFTDLKTIFNTAVIKSGNYYKYDFSLSVSKLFLNYTPWATSQPISYNPNLAETCFKYEPYKVIYSLPAQFESLKDAWYVFPANDYMNFDNKVTSIKSINRSGALIFFDAGSPLLFPGVDQLQTTSGNKLTVGDGGLFSQPLQSIINADTPYEYGSCQDGYSVISTPAGVFWVSQNQGKIFSYQGNIVELSMQDLKWWFASYLPYKLTLQFPNFELTDNPVIGIGCQAAYDNENGLIYFTKRDFKLKDGYNLSDFTYISGNTFSYRYQVGTFELGDPLYFEDASWTISYDPKAKGWLSFHDWHPELIIPGKNTFLTTVTQSSIGSIWSHNLRCDSYCNYYGKNYPFEVEYMINTLQDQTVNSIRSIEYILEVYKYDSNCYDRFHILDANFDNAVVYNTEQVSGMLNLNLSPKGDPFAELAFPQINPTDIDILFEKVEQKYRFNQFWDITDDRGEYNPAAQRMIWNTGANGYVKTLNPNNLNYNKEEMERKKFRHYTNSVWLRKKAAPTGTELNEKFLVLLTNNKDLLSPR